MSEEALEHVMVGFWEKEFDVLVCTTIVESGLDIPNANTLIVDRADSFGLSQLHQIRGASAAAASGRTRTSPSSPTSRSPSCATTGSRPSRRTPRSAPAWRSP
jgi:late competence protein required for DNA uptake (superfamily II DNA/RNA helicase)